MSQELAEEDQTWDDYRQAMTNFTANKNAPHVMLVPLVLGREIGVLAGQLHRSKVHHSVARTKTGALQQCGQTPASVVDSQGVPLSLALLEGLTAIRLTVIRWYEDYPGLFWSRELLLDAPGGDFPYIEWRSTVDKLRRAGRIIGIRAIGDEAVENTPSGIATFKLKLLRPAKNMERAKEIQPVTTANIEITWPDQNTVQPVYHVQPRGAAHTIEGAVNLRTQPEETQTA